MDAEEEEGKTKENGESEEKDNISKPKKIIVFVIVVNILLVSLLVVWYFNFRAWSIEEVAEIGGFEVLEGANTWSDDPVVLNPGWPSHMEGKEITVKGRVTDIEAIMTTQGPLTFYQLDDFELLNIIEWDYPRYEIGDELEKKVRFERSHTNDRYNVYSPQLDFPVFRYLPAIATVTESVSYVAGLILIANQTEVDGEVRVNVYSPYGESYSLEIINCTLKKGTEGYVNEYLDQSVGYRDKPIMDEMPNLVNPEGLNKTIRFTDANENGLFDDEDYFTLNLTKPKKASAALTYYLSINGGISTGSDEARPVGGSCYIVMTNKGVLRHEYILVGNSGPFPRYTYQIEESETSGNATVTIEITRVLGIPPELSNVTCNLVFYNYISSTSFPILNGEIYSDNGIAIDFSNKNNNNFLDKGDQFTISIFDYQDELRFGARDIGSIIDYTWFPKTEGIKNPTRPYIHFKGSTQIDPPENNTYTIKIEKLYHAESVYLGEDEGLYRWYVLRVQRDGEQIIAPQNLTSDYNVTLSDFNILFIDNETNDFLNAGDYFQYQTNKTGEYELIMDYVQGDWVLSFQIVSWTI
jgi:hypothetical protein